MAEHKFNIYGADGMRTAFVACFRLCQELFASGSQGFELTLKPIKSKRSVEQNKFYWKLLRHIAEVTWIGDRRFTDQTWAEYFRQCFIGSDELLLPDGTTQYRGISTTRLNVQEFADYLTQIENWCAEHGVPPLKEQA